MPLARVKHLLVLALILAATAAVYAPSLRSEFVTWDDSSLIYKNPIIKELSVSTVKLAFSSYDPELYIPLTFLSYQIDHLVGGDDPFIYHLQNLFWHLANVALVYCFLSLLTPRRWAVLLAAALFALHPLQTEAVVWASARKDLLSTFFFLASLCCYVLYRRRGTRLPYVSSILLFFLGLLSKVMIITLPVVLVLLDLREGRRLDRRAWMEKIPFVVLAALFGVVALVGKEQVLGNTPPLLALLMAGRSTLFYLEKLLWPRNLSPMYPGPDTIGVMDLLLPFALFLLLLAAAWRWRRAPELAFCAAFFLLTLLPTFTNFAKGGVIYLASDRYAYVPGIGLFFLAAALLARLLEQKSPLLRVSVATVCTGILFAFAGLSYRQSLIWENSTALYRHAIRVSPEFCVPYNNLGAVLLDEGKTDEAIIELQKAIALKPDYVRAHHNLSWAYGKKGMYKEALVELQRAVELDPRSAADAKRLEELMRRVGD